MSQAILNDRAAQFVMAADDLEYDEARRRLERSALVLEATDGDNPVVQAALLGAARCGVRMFKGGVFAGPTITGRLALGQERPRPLRRALQDLGVQTSFAPEHAVRLHLGCGDGVLADIYGRPCGWRAQIGPEPLPAPQAGGNVLSGAATGALGVAELFRRTVLDDILAGRRPASLDLWGGPGPERIARLPQALWLLGLGNLGQATLFLLSLLPWADPAEALLLLHDGDVAGAENIDVQVLTEHGWVGRKKARMAAAWAEAHGFRTLVEERRFSPVTRPDAGDPAIALVGVDNLDARRWAAGAGFGLVLDAGLGATAPEAFDVRIHAFPGAQPPERVWPQIASPERALSKRLSQLVDAGRLDMCGAMKIAGASVGVPCTAVAAAALQLAQLCRALEAGACADRVDLSLSDLGRAAWRMMPGGIATRLPTYMALNP